MHKVKLAEREKSNCAAESAISDLKGKVLRPKMDVPKRELGEGAGPALGECNMGECPGHCGQMDAKHTHTPTYIHMHTHTLLNSQHSH